MNTLGWLRERWNHFWFVPADPGNLGLCRVAFFSCLVLIYLRRDSSPWATVPDVLWMPIDLFRSLRLPVFPGDVLRWLDRLWMVSLVLSAIGFLTRWSTVTAFLVGTYLFGLAHSFGKTHHSDALLVLILGILAVSRCGDAWSVDRALRPPPREDASRGSPGASAEYTWPIRLAWALMSVVFFAAGISKLRESGLAWVLSDNLRFLLLRHQYSHAPLATVGPVLAAYGGLTKVMAAGAIGLELSAPLALLSRRLRLVIVPSLMLLQIGIWALMGVSCVQFLAAYMLWVPWDRVAGARRSRSQMAVRSTRRTTAELKPPGLSETGWK